MIKMRSLKKKRRIQLIAFAFIGLIGATALVGYALRDGINFFRAPSQVMSDPPQEGEVFVWAAWLKRALWCAGKAAKRPFG